jgi:hypothetical protein
VPIISGEQAEIDQMKAKLSAIMNQPRGGFRDLESRRTMRIGPSRRTLRRREGCGPPTHHQAQKRYSPIAAPPPVVIMPRVWMIVVELVMQIPKSPMIGTVLTPALETVLVSACMRFANVIVEPIVLLVIALVSVVVLVRECRRKSPSQKQQSSRCQRSFALVHLHLLV